MKKKIFLLITFTLITLWIFSCAPSPENTHEVFNDSSNHVILGFYHGLIFPCAAAGKVIGLKIGLYHAGKSNFSYWVGYLIALSIYFRIVRFLVLTLWDYWKQ